MTANSPQAYLLSALCHAAAAALILLLGFAVGQHRSDTPKIFELVAGAGDNYAATVAPALGVPGGIKVSLPQSLPVQPIAQPEPAPPEPMPVQAPVQPAPVRPAPVNTAPPVASKATDVPNFTKVVQRTAHRKAARLEAKYKKELEAEERKRESYEQFLREQGAKSGRGSPASRNPRVDAEGIAGGVVGGSTANKTGWAGGKALTREEQSLLDSYFAYFKARLKENHVPPPNVSDKLTVRVEFFMAADGSVSRVHVLRSSGNAEFDQSVLDAFRHTHAGPRPDGRSDEKELEFRMRDEDAE